VKKFKASLNLTAEDICEIEKNTMDQDQSPLWYSVRRYRLTASTFGRIFHMRPNTPPDAFVRQLLDKQKLSTKAVKWGKSQEHLALQQYVDLQLTSGHNGLVAVKAGFVICEQFPFLGATPDACVHDPSRTVQYGLVEIKCPYKYRNVLPEHAASNSDFCSFVTEKNGKRVLSL